MRLLACLIVAPQRGYDEPATLSYAISSFCPTSADGLHFLTTWLPLTAAYRPPRDNRFSRVDEVTSRGEFDGYQIPHGRCGWFQGFLSRGGASRCAEATATARLPERGPHVP